MKFPARSCALACALFFAAWIGDARAQDLGLELRVIEPPEPEEDEDEDDDDDDDEPEVVPPHFVAQVDIDRPSLGPEDFTLEALGADPPVQVEADEVVTYKESDAPMALAVLVQGNFRWMGNETYMDPDDPDTGTIYTGAYSGLGPAIDVLADMGPPGSQAGLYVFRDGSLDTRQPMEDASSLSGTALGSQRDYEDSIAKPFMVGLDEAWQILAEISGYRRILVVIGDGTDPRGDIEEDLRNAIERFQDIDAEVYTIHYTPLPGEGPQGQGNMRNLGYSGHYAATSRDHLRSYAGSIASAVGSRYFVRFPGEDFIFDGEAWEMLVEVGGREATQQVALPVWAPPEPDEGMSWGWLWWVLAIILLVGIVVAVVILIRHKRAQMPPPVEEPEAPAPAPSRTVMMGAGGDDNAMPIVGWIVPLGGPAQYHTFKLLQGSTRLGTAGQSHILIQDQYMSTEHAEIVSSPHGFVLNDLGSTNGVHVMQQRVQTHELVDNDTFTLGQTEFKFKSIN